MEPMPISLCMICGNEEAVILNCLESAKTAFEELCLVRAIGDQTADGTLDIAAKWCSENGKGMSDCRIQKRDANAAR
jgi:glycosyltransferase involved in cell wall biosynthesis